MYGPQTVLQVGDLYVKSRFIGVEGTLKGKGLPKVLKKKRLSNTCFMTNCRVSINTSNEF